MRASQTETSAYAQRLPTATETTVVSGAALTGRSGAGAGAGSRVERCSRAAPRTRASTTRPTSRRRDRGPSGRASGPLARTSATAQAGSGTTVQPTSWSCRTSRCQLSAVIAATVPSEPRRSTAGISGGAPAPPRGRGEVGGGAGAGGGGAPPAPPAGGGPPLRPPPPGAEPGGAAPP